MKNVKRIISVITVLAMIAVMFSAVTLTTAAADITYTGSVDLQGYISLTGKDDGSTDIKLDRYDFIGNNSDPGYHTVTTGETPTLKSGSLVYAFANALENVRFGTSFSNYWWTGSVEFFSSSDGENWTAITTERTLGGFNWPDGNSNSEVYDTATFTKEQNVRYLKVNLNNSALQAGLFSILYSDFGPAAAYADTVAPQSAIVTEGTPLDGGANFGAPYNYFDPSGSYTFASKDLSPITDFCAKVLLHNPHAGTSLKAEVSSDGVNYKKVILGLAKNGEYENPAWDCSGYDAYGSFTKEDNIRFVKFNLINTITCAAGIRAFSYNSADMGEAYYANTFDIVNASTEEGNAVSGSPAGGYFVTKDGAATEGSMIFYDANGISDFKAEYAQVFEAYGAVYFYASVDGETWDTVTGNDFDTGEVFAGDFNCHKHIFTTTLAPFKGYKYLKAFFKNGAANPNFPVVFNVYYNNASQMGVKNPTLDSSEYKDAYDVTFHASSSRLTATALDEGATYMDVHDIGAGFQISGSYAFGKDGAWKRGYVQFYEGAVITDLNIDAYAQSVGAKGSEMELEVSSDGKVWLPVNTTKSIFDDTHYNAGWGAGAESHNYVSLDPAAKIHYVRITFNRCIGWLDFAPALDKISYNYVKVEETDYTMCNGHEFGINSGDAIIKTPYVDGAEFKDAGAELSGYNAFFDANGWQPGEIVFYNKDAMTDYALEAVSGNVSAFGIIKLYASADGVNYTILNPAKQTYQEINPAWGEVKHNYFYGKLLASADIHYLKVEYVEKGVWIQNCPAVRTLWLNTVETCNNKGHQNGEPVTVPATCTKEGSITTTCARCGETTVEVIPVIDHSFTEYVSDNNATPVQDGTKTAHCDHGCGTTDTITEEGSRFEAIYEDVADSDGDGVINSVDYTAFRKVVMNELTADLNGDGVTDIRDLIRLKKFILNSVADLEINVDSAVSEDSSLMD